MIYSTAYLTTHPPICFATMLACVWARFSIVQRPQIDFPYGNQSSHRLRSPSETNPVRTSGDTGAIPFSISS
jgi:hypothetical protein